MGEFELYRAGILLPIIFIHGFLGFDYIPLGFHRVYYFRRLHVILARQGVPAYFPALPPHGTIARRAQVLADYLAGIPGPGLHLVGHSMGGLDARYLIHHLDPGHRVRSLTTVGTPHHGSPIAEWALETVGPIQWVGRRWWRAALEELTPRGCTRFNETVPDRPDVRYESYGAARPLHEMPPWFRPWTRLMNGLGEDNDSQVPIASTCWGNFQGVQRADHLELVGWNLGMPSRQIQRPFDHVRFYREIVTKLAGQTTDFR